jgi:haloacetate dehalogenase
MFDGFQHRRIEAGEATIDAVIGGSGPPVLLLHGFPQSKALWARVAPLLAERHTVVATDLRGYGDSSKPKNLPGNAPYSFRAMADDQVKAMAALGFKRFHAIGHDRGGRTAHRMALDNTDKILSLSVLDIVPTYTMFMETSRHVAGVYWHWYFLALPEPFPERLIGADPDYFYETCLTGWGGATIADFDAEQLAEYRRCWRDPAMIHGSCSDYRAAATIDLADDTADRDRRVACPTLALWGRSGAMAAAFDIAGKWRECASDLTAATVEGGHFFIDQKPQETAATLTAFLDRQARA